LFNTPEWLIDKNIIGRIEHSGITQRISKIQTRALNSILNYDRMSRMIENEIFNKRNAYSLLSMVQDLKKGIWSELRNGKAIDTYRRNLQRAFIEKLADISTEEDTKVNQSDIKSIVRSELISLQREVRSGLNITKDRMSRIHLQDVLKRIDAILNPKD
jgi:hypothetical protein